MTQGGEKRGSFARSALVISVAAAVALGAGVLWLRAGAREAQAQLDASLKQYEDMRTLKPRVQALVQRMPKGAQQEAIDPSKIASFLSATASKVGLPNPSIRQTTPPKSGSWVEFASVIDLRGGRDGSVSRGPFVDFLSTVERERSYLKSKELSMTFGKDGADLASARVIISYFRRE